MASMSLETALLSAMLRLARRRAPATLDQLLVRVDADAAEARSALASLARAGLVHVVGDQPRLTMVGFAIAVATAAVTSERRRAARGERRAPGREARAKRVVPLVRRRRAA